MVDYVIPGNDDAVRAVKVVLGALTNAIVEANGGTLVDYVTEDDAKKQMRFEKNNDKKVNNDKKGKNFKEKRQEKVEVKEEPKKEEVKVQEKKEEKPEVTKKETKIDLSILTVAELRDLAKKKEIKGYSKMKKDELIENLK